jgi:hypothetical protein
MKRGRLRARTFGVRLDVRLAALALGALALLGAAQPPSTPAPQAATISVPLTSDGEHLFAQVRLDGSPPLRFAIDTAGGQLVDTALATRLGLRRGRSIRVAGVGNGEDRGWTTRVARVQIGDAAIDNVPFVAMPIEHSFGQAEGAPIDGIIGPALLRRFTVTIDATNEMMTLAPRGSGPLGEVPLLVEDGHPAVPCRIEDVETRCQLDTGSRLAVTLLRPFLAAHPAIASLPQTADGVDGYGIGGPARGRLGYVALTLGGRTIRVVADYTSQQKGAFAHGALGGNVGERVLRRFVVTYDLARRRVHFAPSSAVDEPDRIDRSGLFLIRSNDVTRVLNVRPGTPGASAGLRDGDVIVAIDGRDASSLSLGAMRTLLSDPNVASVTLRVRGAGGERDVDVALANYVPNFTVAGVRL